MPTVVSAALSAPRPGLPTVVVPCTRQQLAKLRWRAAAADGSEWIFTLESRLAHGQVIGETASAQYVLEQAREPLLEVSLDLPPSAAAGVGWAVGNLHLELMSEPHRLLTPDSPAARQLLARLGLNFRTIEDRFRPGRFARGLTATHELGSSHQH